MKKIIAIFTMIVNVIVINASELLDHDTLTRIKRMDNCLHRSQSKRFDYFDLNDVIDSRATGYRVNFPFSVVANKTAAIILSTSNRDASSSFYEIQFSTRDDRSGIWILRNLQQLSHVPSTSFADVHVRLTDSNVLTVTTDDAHFFYNEASPFAINYYGFATLRKNDEALFYYNCRSKHSNNVDPIPTSDRLEPSESLETPAQCGQRKIEHQPLITHGSRTEEGDWPWHAAIWHTQDERRSYACGGTLISVDAVITAGHCLYDFGRPIVPGRVIVQLGKHHLQLAGKHTQEFQAHRLIIHDSYDQNIFRNDIAIIRLATEATFTPYVQPICLWDVNQGALEKVIGRNGIVVGWGLNERAHLSEDIDLAYMPVVSPVDCLESDPDFFGSFIRRGTFCAGSRNGTGACNGDSGGGMYFEENGSYALRGIVSQARARSSTQNVCDPKHYVVFTDAAHYFDWIREKVK